MSKLGFRIPSDWKIYKLSDIAEVQTGIAKNASNEFIDPVELPYLRVANVQFGYLDLSQIKTIKIEREKLQKYLLQYGDVLLTEGGDADKLGRGTIWQGELSECLHQNHVFAVRPNPRKVLSKYLGWLTESTLGRKYFQLASKQTTNLASINSTQLKNFVIAIPSIAEQQSIINIISTLENAIALTEKLITAKRRLKQGLMQKLLTGKIRFPEFKNDLWHMQMLSKACQINIGGTPSRQEPNYWANSSKDGFPWVSIRDMSGRFIARTKEYITAEGIRKSNTKSVPKGTTLMSFKLTIGRVAQAGCELYTNEAIAAFFPKDNLVDQDYLYAALPLAVKRVDTDQAVKGITLNKRKLETLLLPILSIREQKKIAQVDKLLDQEISLLEKQLHSLKTQKQGLMQQLLTGKIRVQTP
ncbi:hypothetical protein B9G53_20440 [Pseudanabaena sp. SR411]|uniref:restriction endonuclease subunit S n=1 Tax=Pseudanabaena sp. SR411 TaxID=1980935 RepID=UPI000B98855F|nr:restriction endonuclease subunit S [Pseudanabaena sp. SR411]OYQ62803.1 hypothetical protein B9G53_20440 [Pseudanabaena sp. SR411]